MPGDFYVTQGCCTLCGIPEAEAPDMFGSNKEQCFVKRQPERRRDMRRMLQIVQAQDQGCIRYSGTNLHTLATLMRRKDHSIVDAGWWLRLCARMFGRLKTK